MSRGQGAPPQRQQGGFAYATYHKSHLITIPATVNRQVVDLIVDTGASMNIVSKDFASRAGRAASPTNSVIRSVSGELVNSSGQVELDISVGPMKLGAMQFVVLDSFPHDILCGLPFCTATGMVIDFPANTITLKGHPLKLCIAEGQASGQAAPKAYCMEGTIIPPNSEVLLQVKIAAHGTYLVEPIPGAPASRPTVARTLTQVRDGVGCVRVANVTSVPAVVAKGTALGQTTPLSAVQLTTTLPKKDEQHIMGVTLNPDLNTAECSKFQCLLKEYSHLFVSESPPGSYAPR